LYSGCAFFGFALQPLNLLLILKQFFNLSPQIRIQPRLITLIEGVVQAPQDFSAYCERVWGEEFDKFNSNFPRIAPRLYRYRSPQLGKPDNLNGQNAVENGALAFEEGGLLKMFFCHCVVSNSAARPLAGLRQPLNKMNEF